jgi:pyruvate formate lyase activating enzyme
MTCYNRKIKITAAGPEKFLPAAADFPEALMHIGGFQKLTLLDFPGQVACIIFTAGCNFCCPFCHNAGLVVHAPAAPAPAEAEIFAYLEKRRGLLDGVVISGGEPLLQGDLLPFLQKIKALGYLVKLDTNGSFPGALEKILAAKLVDYVAMDIKQAPDKYNLAIGHYYASGASANPTAVRNATNSGSLSPVPRIKLSLELLRKSGVPFELRTTLVRGIHSEADLEALARWIAGPQPYFLQSYVDSGDVIDNRNLAAFPPETLARFLTIAKKYCPRAELRGVH